MKLFRFLINTNIFISLSAVSLALATQVQLGMKLQFRPYLFIIFFATLFEYNIHRLITVFTHKEALDDEKHKWVKEQLNVFFLLVILSVAGFLCAVFFAKKEVLITFAPVATLTLFYSFPVFKTRKQLFRLREIAYLKILLIAFVWSAVTVFLPVVESGNSYNKGHVFLIFAERLLFLFAITIPFDIRDMRTDERAGLKTIPLLIGEKNALATANVFIVLFFLFTVIHYSVSLRFLLPAFTLSAITTLVFLNNKKLKQISFYHYGILDGALLLQGVLVCICYCIQATLFSA